MDTGKMIMNVIRADLVGMLTPERIIEIGCIAENINASNSVISNDDLEGVCLAKLQGCKLN